MRIDAVAPGVRTPQAAEASLRLLNGALAEAKVGQVLTATILETRGGAALLDLAGARVLVEGLPPLPSGATIPLRVTGVAPALTLEPAGPPTLAPSLNFQQGEVVTGRVLTLLPEGNFLVDIQGQRLEATAPPGLEPGMELTLRVLQVQPQAVFQVVEGSPSLESLATRMVRAHLGEVFPAGQTLTFIQKALADVQNPFSPESVPASVSRLQTTLARLLPVGKPPTAEQLQTLVREGGLHLEAKLAAGDSPAIARDVKAQVLQVLHDLSSAPKTAQFEELTGALTRQIEHTQTQQAIQLLARLHDAPIPLQIPIPQGQEWKTAFLSIDPQGGRGGKADKQQGYNLLFLLELEGLGKTRIDAHFDPRGVRAVFYLEDHEGLQRVRKALPEFQRHLQKMGLGDVLLAARPAVEMGEEKRRAVDALPVGVPIQASLVDVRA